MSESLCDFRKDFSMLMKERYPSKYSWRRVRFSDEAHCGWGPEGKLWITRKPGERYCKDCIQEQNEPKEKDKERIHCWGSIGYNFKSELIFYTSKSPNGKLSHDVYADQILNIEVKRWIDKGDVFCLEEDRDSGHGYARSRRKNRPTRWKDTHLTGDLSHYYNAPHSPDLSPIEHMWSIVKNYVNSRPHWNDEDVKMLMREAWDSVKYKTINKWIDSMPKRFQDVIDHDGKMTGN
ncbi:hypothetical protein C1H76_7795 [Elsinoe australis]|uniref:Tc1-like transposase DDE domain-containing protein n=1 Tax=Elsinoe australis TaxID=40998 RepID=A0A4V6DTC8_9PEZI|nr:hypothetical protein C1H76_7795 [Elsinoe australis]